MLVRGWMWDIRLSQRLIELCELIIRRRKAYWWKISVVQAQEIVNLLSEAYGIKPCRVSSPPPKDLKCIACYDPEYGIRTYAQPHIKSVFHEWYHHLDFETVHRYDSSDGHGGDDSKAWQFADLMWAVLTTELKRRRKQREEWDREKK